MASFVREVLSATGTLGEKEDFPGKILKIQKKLHDLKTSLMVHIDNKYSNFSSNLNEASNVTNQMKELRSRQSNNRSSRCRGSWTVKIVFGLKTIL